MNDKFVKERFSTEQYDELLKITKPKGIDWNGLILFISPYLMCIVFFNYEAKIVKNKLNLILKIENHIC
jgi:hypothetical protein